MTAPTTPESGYLSPRAIATLRARAERGMTARADVQQPTRTRVGPGQYRDEPATVPGMGAVKCAFRPATTPREAVRADAVQALSEFEVTFPHGTPIDETMTLVISHLVAGVPAPLTLQVTGVERTSRPEIVRRVYASDASAPAPVEAAAP